MSRLHDYKTGKVKEEKRIAELKKQKDDEKKVLESIRFTEEAE